MTHALEDHEGTVSTGGRTITNLRFADDIGELAGEELAKLDERFDKVSTSCGMEINAEKTLLMTNNTSGMEISAEKTQLMTNNTSGMEISAEKTKLTTNNTSGINTKMKVNGQKLETVTNFKYLGSVINDEGSKPEILTQQDSTDNSSIDKVETSLE